ncbi:hypothetical protein [Salinigranum sp.]|uniref:hypothetical protein n=1 Tax=Salinigranum sp. TaxID=1966351 RepID=UPI00356AA6E7
MTLDSAGGEWDDRTVTVRDDHVLPLTRWVARGIVPFLAAAFFVLYGVPDRTAEFFAWTIRPEMTPVVMGAGYGAGVYFFYRVSTAERWHTVAPVFLGIAVFTWLMAVATVLHWENFNHGHHTFVLWVLLYAVTPLLVPAVWIRNRRTLSTEPDANAVRLPRVVRLVGGVLGTGLALGAVALFVAPGPMIDSWPWTVSPLTARVLAGWFALFGIVNAVVVLDPRWSGARVLVQSQVLGFALVLVGVVRYWENFDPSNPLTGAVVGGMALYLLAVAVLYLWMERR